MNKPGRIYFFHEQGGTPDTVVEKIASRLHEIHNVGTVCPYLPHSNPAVKAEESYAWVQRELLKTLVPGSILVGIGLGGLIAAKLQEDYPLLDLTSVCIAAPTEQDDLKLELRVEKRIVLYSAMDKTLLGRNKWWEYADRAYNVAWLMNGFESVRLVKYSITYLLSAYLNGQDLQDEIDNLHSGEEVSA